MKWIDTHTHIYLDSFDEDRDDVIREAQTLGFSALLLPNIDVESIVKIQAVCKKYPGFCMPMIGLHPCDVKDGYLHQLNILKEILDNSTAYFSGNKIVAIGEIGLDYYWDKAHIEIQKHAFSIQIEWALASDLPIVIHTRDAIDDAIAIISGYRSAGLRGVFHCFSGDERQAQTIVDLGLLLGIGGVLTYKKSTLPDAIANIPLEAIVLETDAPFLPPVPYRGKRNEPKYMLEVAKRLSEIKDLNISDISAITTANAKDLFRLQ